MSKIPKGWYKVTEGHIKSTDRLLVDDCYMDASQSMAGWEVSTFKKVIRKFPDGWEQVTNGHVMLKDQLWDRFKNIFQNTSVHSVGDPVDRKYCVIRKIEPIIPVGWSKIYKGLTTSADKCLVAGEWDWLCSGDRVSNYQYVIRRDDLIPEGWLMVYDGQVKEGDKIWAGLWKLAKGLIGDPTTRTVTIRKKEPKIPEGYELVTEGKADMCFKCGVWQKACAISERCVGGFLLARKIQEPKIPEGWFLVKEGRVKENDMLWFDSKVEWSKHGGTYINTVMEPSDCVIRKIQDPSSTIPEIPIPDGYEVVTEGRTRQTDYHLHGGRWTQCWGDRPLSDDVVIRRIK